MHLRLIAARRADPLLFMTLLEETTLGRPCVLCKSRVKATRHQTLYPEILRLDITTVLHSQPVQCMGPDDLHYYYGEPYKCVCIMCNTGANHWVAVVKGQGGQWWHYDDRKGDGTATKTSADKAASDTQIWHSPVLIYTRTRGQRKEHEKVLIEEAGRRRGGRMGKSSWACKRAAMQASEGRHKAMQPMSPKVVATAVDCCVRGTWC